MTRSRKHKHNTTSAGPQHQRYADQGCEASTPEEVSYAPPPGPPPQEASTSSADTVELHPQATQASFLRLKSSSPQRDVDAAEQHTVHFVDIHDSYESPSTSEGDLPISQHATAGTESPCGNGSQSDSLQQSLPRIAVHASTVSDLQTSTPHQSFTISAGPRAQKLYYLWSPKHKQPDAAAASESYIESFDDGKRRLLKQGSSPFADVTKQQVARMATWAPDPADNKHSRKHLRPWWVRLVSPWQKPRKNDGEASGDDDSPSDPDAEPAMPSWRWKLVVFLCCLVAMICYVDRAAMSVAIIPMSLQYGWSNSVKGAINRYALYVSNCP